MPSARFRDQAERGSGVGRKLFGFIAESVFTFIPETCSGFTPEQRPESSRNRVHLRPDFSTQVLTCITGIIHLSAERHKKFCNLRIFRSNFWSTIVILMPDGRRTNMRAMRAEAFNGYKELKLVDVPKPVVTDGKVLVRITAAGVTPLDYTILSGQFHGMKAPLVLGNEGAGVVETGGGADFPTGSRVMFFGRYGAFEDGTYSEWVAVRKEDLCLIPDNVDDVTAAGIPVAYLTAQVALTRAGFRAGKTVFAAAIGGSVGNAVTQLARALGAKHAMSSTTNHAKAEQAKELGFNEVIDTSLERLADGVRRITEGYGADIVIDGIGGEVLSEALGALAFEGSLTTLGYSASRQTTIDVTNLIVPQASIRSLNMFTQPKTAVAEAWNVIVSLLKSGAIKPIVAKTFPLSDAAEALRYLIEDRPFGRVILTI
jgi:NADPH:quinone reductase